MVLKRESRKWAHEARSLGPLLLSQAVGVREISSGAVMIGPAIQRDEAYLAGRVRELAEFLATEDR